MARKTTARRVRILPSAHGVKRVRRKKTPGVVQTHALRKRGIDAPVGYQSKPNQGDKKKGGLDAGLREGGIPDPPVAPVVPDPRMDLFETGIIDLEAGANVVTAKTNLMELEARNLQRDLLEKINREARARGFVDDARKWNMAEIRREMEVEKKRNSRGFSTNKTQLSQLSGDIATLQKSMLMAGQEIGQLRRGVKIPNVSPGLTVTKPPVASPAFTPPPPSTPPPVRPPLPPPLPTTPPVNPMPGPLPISPSALAGAIPSALGQRNIARLSSTSVGGFIAPTKRPNTTGRPPFSSRPVRIPTSRTPPNVDDPRTSLTDAEDLLLQKTTERNRAKRAKLALRRLSKEV